jgi:hypothetical protein
MASKFAVIVLLTADSSLLSYMPLLESQRRDVISQYVTFHTTDI